MTVFPAVIELSSLDGTNGFAVVVNGVVALGSSAGDVNGDGFDDILFGDPGAGPNGTSSGSSYVVFGAASGFGSTLDLSSLDGSNGFRIDGVAAINLSGSSVSSAGDVNGDGFDDILVGAYLAGPNGRNSGSSYVVFGAASGFGATLGLSSLDGSNGFRIDGVAAYDYSGRSVSSAGDVNGDGFDDILVGAFYADPNGGNSGSSYVVFGAASGFGSTLGLSSLDGSNGFRIDGVAAGDWSGFSVSSAGDVNGDGFDDILIGARGADPNGSYSGSSYVVFGAASGFGSTLGLSSLDGSNGFRIDGVAAGDFSGYSVSSAGDVNGDGFDDILIGAWGADPNGSYSGSSYVVFGAASGFAASLALSDLDGSNGFRIDGVAAGDRSGYSVSSAGDVNGDGLGDILIGAWGADPNGSYSGSSYVVFGKASGFAATLELSTLDGANGFTINGINENDRSGRWVSSAGDVNGDGFDDILIRARDTGPNLLFGRGPGDFPAVLDLVALGAATGTQFDGLTAGDRLGASVASAGDVNGDGFADIVVGARFASGGTGAAYVVFGTAGGLGTNFDLSSLNGSNGFRLDGASASRTGDAVATAGDINGDGFDDIIVGAWSGGTTASGESYVVFGKASGFGPSFTATTLDGTNGFVINGIDASDYSGRSVSSAGDINGDGFDDLLVSARGADVGAYADAGETYVIYGKASGFGAALNLSDLDGTNGFRIDGVAANDRSGFQVSAAGDLNDDGFDDFIIGAPSAGSTGEAYVVFGSAGSPGASISLTDLDGTNGFKMVGAVSDTAGYSVADAGDVNGDGIGDIIVGARTNGGSGGAYVVFGKTSSFAATLDLTTLDGSDGFLLTGVSGSDNAGGAVSSAGDVNGDGFDDLLIGARFADPFGKSAAGTTYVVFGKASGFGSSMDLGALDGANGFRLDGKANSDFLGFSVAAGGDVNGDGFGDLMASALAADPNGRDYAGETYLIYGRAPTSAVTRIGAAGDQIIRGGAFNDTLNGLGGDDELFGAGGDDRLLGGAGNDILRGGAGNDTLIGGLGTDTLYGGPGVDAASYETASAGLTIDLTTPANNTGEATGDTFVSIEVIIGSAFTDLMIGNGGSNTFNGGAGNDIINGGTGADILYGGDGNDTLDGEEGGDTLDGGAGNDILFGGIQSDTILGGTGKDTIAGANGGDTIDGGAGKDNIIGQGGSDTIDGKGGADTISGGNANDTIRGGGGADVIDANDGNDTVFGGGGADIINGGKAKDTIKGQGGDDTINGNSERDTLSGGGGDDIINGGSGNDILKGQTGDDILNGQQGDDTLTGNAGNDIFMFNGQGNDTITDMLSGNALRDQIDVSSQGFANFNQVMARATQVGNDVVFNIGSGSLTVENHAISDFVANDFIL